jgi:hypothetical protein
VTAASPYGEHIFANHAALLAASAISPEVARERGYVSAGEKTRLERAKFAKSQRIVPSLLIPIYGTDGELRLHQNRPDNPRLDNGKPRKYETPWRKPICLDVPRRVQAQLENPEIPLWITEGARKADAAVTAGLCCIALIGVDGWQSNGVALPDWKLVRLKGREVVIAYDSDVMSKPPVGKSLQRITTWLQFMGAKVRHVILPQGMGDAKVGLDDFLSGYPVEELAALARDPEPAKPVSAVRASPARQAEKWQGDPAVLLDDVHRFITDYVRFPSETAAHAVTLWAAHCHAPDSFESTPRVALLSPEPGSGKTRTLEVLELLTPRPMHALNASTAAIFRSIEKDRPTLLIDECDAIFTKHGKDDSNEDLRAMLNAGHRKGAVIPRCTGLQHDVTLFPVYAAVALAGLGDLPATLMSRSVVVRMRRRAPGETVEPFRVREATAHAKPLAARLAAWMAHAAPKLTGAYPEMPPGITDRPADVWEPLIAVADAAGGDWPKRARAACTEMAAAAETGEASLGVRLLGDLAEVFGDAEQLPTAVILERLRNIEEAPWAALGKLEKPLDARGLASRLRGYGVKSTVIRVGDATPRGYRAEDLQDAWTRYVPESRASATSATPQHPQADGLPGVADDGGVADGSATPDRAATDSDAPASGVADVADVALLRGTEPGDDDCAVCGNPLDPALAASGDHAHPGCDPWETT